MKIGDARNISPPPLIITIMPLKNSTSSFTHSSSSHALNGIFRWCRESNKYRNGFLGIENRKLKQTCSPFDRHSTHYFNIGDSARYSRHARAANDDGFVTPCPKCFFNFYLNFRLKSPLFSHVLVSAPLTHQHFFPFQANRH